MAAPKRRAPRAPADGGESVRKQDESAEERVERKAKQYSGPIAKARKHIVKPQLGDLYPWAANRGKIERAHTHVSNKGRTDENPKGDHRLTDVEEGTPAFEQAVMDHYTLHAGLVIGQEKATVVGRKKIGNFRANTDVEHPNGSTTTDVVGPIDEENGSDEMNDKKGDEDEE